MNKCEVVRVDRSPMNATRWALTLKCGREVWVTAKRRPAAKSVRCVHMAGES